MATKPEKIANLRKQIEANERKSKKLKDINRLLENQILKLSKPPKGAPTEEEKRLQSAKDKKQFSDQLSRANLLDKF